MFITVYIKKFTSKSLYQKVYEKSLYQKVYIKKFMLMFTKIYQKETLFT